MISADAGHSISIEEKGKVSLSFTFESKARFNTIKDCIEVKNNTILRVQLPNGDIYKTFLPTVNSRDLAPFFEVCRTMSFEKEYADKSKYLTYEI